MRYSLSKLEKLDQLNKTSVVRQLEMVADEAITTPGYTIQFWKDVSLYSIDEAILYVRNGDHGDADKIQQAWDKIKNEIHT